MGLQHLPERFPVGTRYVVEGRAGEGGFLVHSRYLELPDGRRLALPRRAVRWPVPGRTTAVGRSGRQMQKKRQKNS
jgi:hypothetical protein